MVTGLAALFLLLIALAGWVVLFAMFKQEEHDRKRHTYRIESFPVEVDETDAAAWLWSIRGTLRPFSFNLVKPTIVPEVWADGQNELVYRLRLPWQHHEYIADQLRSHIPGLRLEEERDPPEHDWLYITEIGVAHTVRTLGIGNEDNKISIEHMARTVRSPLRRRLNDGERILMQWVVAPARTGELPQFEKAQTAHPRATQFLKNMQADRDEITDRRKKLAQPNMHAVLRIAATAENKDRAKHLVDDVRKAVCSAPGEKAYFKHQFWFSQDVLKERIARALTPFHSPAQLMLSELLALMAWPVGNKYEPGVATSMARHLPPTSLIPSDGRDLGIATMYGHRRPVAMSYDTVQHVYALGATNVGKTTTLEHMSASDMEHGFGVIVIEADGNLFDRVLQRVPDKRVDHTYIVDLGDMVRPVGFNIFDQHNSRTAIDELSILIDRMYRDSARSITSPRMLYNFAHALAEVPGATFVDLATLITPAPKTSPAGLWREHVARQVKDPEISSYLQSFLNMTPTEQDREVRPLYNRTWEFMRPEVKTMLGQRVSSFKMVDIIRDNKILLVNLGNCGSPIAAQLIGTFLVNAIRQAVNTVQAKRTNFLYLDEFEQFMGFYADMDAILDRARKRNLGLVLAHQRLSQLPPPMIDGIMTNTATKLVFRTSSKNAAIMAQEFGGLVKESDFVGLPNREAIALIGTTDGKPPPVSITTMAPGESTGNAQRIRGLSQKRYGRPIKDVERELATYAVPASTPQRRRPQISGSD